MDPVFQATDHHARTMRGFVVGKWYFWDETWANANGPHETRAEAEGAADAYGFFLNNSF